MTIQFKKSLALSLALALTLSLTACGDTTTETQPPEPTTADSTVAAGTYTGEGIGQRGPVKVSVTVTGEGTISDIEVTEHAETDGIYQAAFEMVPAQIMAGQTLNVDSATGATMSSIAIKNAVRDALTQAGVVDAFTKADAYHAEPVSAEDRSVDVVVVGSGFAGMLAAYKVAKAGKSVIVLEKNAYAGGATPRCAMFFYAANTSIQLEAGQAADDYGGFSVDPAVNPFINKYLFEAETEAIDMMISEGAKFMSPTSFSLETAPGRGQGGGAVTKVVVDAVEKLGGQFFYETPAIELIGSDKSTVTGVVAQNKAGEVFTISAKAVILATGGWAYNRELVETYTPDVADAPKGGNFYASGDGITMAAAFDAALRDMEEGNLGYKITQNTMQYTSFVNGGIMVDLNGDRFLNESNGAYAYIDENVGNLNNGYKYYQIFDEAGLDLIMEDGLAEALLATGAMVTYNSIEELATIENLPNLTATIERYNGFAAKGEDEDFGRNANDLVPIATENTTYYCIPSTIGYYTSLGGLDVDIDGHVLNTSGNIINNLYAAGEVTGNILYREERTYGGGVGTAIGMGWGVGETVANELS